MGARAPRLIRPARVRPVRAQIVLIRHPAPNVSPGTCYGRLDAGCLPGADLQHLAGALAAWRPTRLWSSPARRCRLPVLSLGRQLGLAPRIDHRLQELDFSAWEGRLWADIPRVRLDAWAHAPLGRGAPDGESVAGLLGRARSFACTLRAPGRHVVVAHAGPIVVLTALLQCRRPDLLARRPAFGEAVFIATH